MEKCMKDYYNSNMTVNRELIDLCYYYNLNLHEVEGLEHIITSLFTSNNKSLIYEAMRIISNNKHTLFARDNNMYKYDCLSPRLFNSVKRRKKLLKCLLKDIRKNAGHGGISFTEKIKIYYSRFITYFR